MWNPNSLRLSLNFPYMPKQKFKKMENFITFGLTTLYIYLLCLPFMRFSLCLEVI